MSWNGEIVIDLDSHIVERADRFSLYEVAQELDLPLLAHGGTARPPYGPGTFDLDGAWFLLHSFANPWAGSTTSARTPTGPPCGTV